MGVGGINFPEYRQARNFDEKQEDLVELRVVEFVHVSLALLTVLPIVGVALSSYDSCEHDIYRFYTNYLGCVPWRVEQRPTCRRVSVTG